MCENEMLTIIANAEEAYRNVNSRPGNRVYYDADSILTEVLQDVPIGLFTELCKLYRDSKDPDGFEALFLALTGMSFEGYLRKSIEDTREILADELRAVCVANVPVKELYKTRANAERSIGDSLDKMQAKPTRSIESFRGEYAFLSNFFPCQVNYMGKTYSCSEAAFQAQKCPERADEFTILNASEAKRLGRRVIITESDWAEHRIAIMGEIVWNKFMNNPVLAQKLLDTEDAILIEGNDWGDTFWGVCDGKGENNLGKILMKTRRQLRMRCDSYTQTMRGGEIQ